MEIQTKRNGTGGRWAVFKVNSFSGVFKIYSPKNGFLDGLKERSFQDVGLAILSFVSSDGV